MNSSLSVYCMSMLLLASIVLTACSAPRPTEQPKIIFQSDDTAQQANWPPEKIAPNYEALARDLVRQKHYEVALGQLNMALEEGPGSAEVYYLQGVCLRETDRPEEALASFAKALQYDPKYARAYNGMGLVHVKDDLFGKAIEAFTRAVELDPARADFINNLGYAYLMDKQFTQAEHFFIRSLAIDSEYTTARNNLALCYGFVQRDKDAFKVLREKAPAQVAYHNMAVIYRLVGKHTKAAEAEQKAISLNKEAAEGAPGAATEENFLEPKPTPY